MNPDKVSFGHTGHPSLLSLCVVVVAVVALDAVVVGYENGNRCEFNVKLTGNATRNPDRVPYLFFR